MQEIYIADLNIALPWKLLMLPSSMLEDRDKRVRLECVESSRDLDVEWRENIKME